MGRSIGNLGTDDIDAADAVGHGNRDGHGDQDADRNGYFDVSRRTGRRDSREI
jgi:hypothetical protein